MLFGGDYQMWHGPPSRRVRDLVRGVFEAARAKTGVFACVGNHDDPGLIEELRRDHRILENESVDLGGGRRLAVCGDAWSGRDDVEKAMQGIPPAAFTLMLSHSPDIARPAARAGVAVLLCGHTHAGQVKLPIVGSPVKRVRADRSVYRDDHVIEGMNLHISSGFGYSVIPVRIGSRCSVTEMTIGPAQA